MTPRDTLDKLWQRGTEFLGCPYAIMGGAMSWVSEHRLVAALSNAGAFGVIAASAMGPEALEREIIETKKLLHSSPRRGEVGRGAFDESSRSTRPLPNPPPKGEGKIPSFGVNLIIMHPQLEALIEVCRAQNVSHVVLAGGIPKSDTVKAVKSFAKVMGFAPSAGIGKKLVKMGVDALVIEGMEAGGHIGPVSTSVLAQEILPAIREVPVFVAGGIGRGEAIVSYLEMGAAGCQLGTRFVCAEESIAHTNFKNLFIHSAARDATTSVQVDPDFPVIPVRAIANKATEAFIRCQHQVIARYRKGELEKKEAQLEIEHFWAGALRRAVIDGDVENGSVMAGQSVGMVGSVQPVAAIIAELLQQAEAHLALRASA